MRCHPINWSRCNRRTRRRQRIPRPDRRLASPSRRRGRRDTGRRRGRRDTSRRRGRRDTSRGRRDRRRGRVLMANLNVLREMFVVLPSTVMRRNLFVTLRRKGNPESRQQQRQQRQHQQHLLASQHLTAPYLTMNERNRLNTHSHFAQRRGTRSPRDRN